MYADNPKFRCCFCSKDIDLNKTDPCIFNAVVGIGQSKKTQYSQRFFCHLECFKEKTKGHASLYLEHFVEDDE